MSIENRQYQLDLVERARQEIHRGSRSILIQAATGSGKTVCASLIIKAAVARGSRVLFMAAKRELINQCSHKLTDFGIDHGIIMSGRGYNLDRLVQVASKDTLWARTKRGVLELPPADLVFVDECHGAMANVYQELLKKYPNIVHIGLTATPCRTDNRGLGDMYTSLLCAIPVSDLIKMGYLVPTRVFAPYRPDLKGVKITAGDYNKRQLEKVLNKAQLVGDIVEHWKRIASDRSTIVFASGVSHSLNIKDQFLAAGIKAEHLDAKTPTEEREEIEERFHRGETQILTNVNVLSEGYDCPRCSCVVLAQSTKSLARFLQRAGRPRRPFTGKENALFIDHSGSVYFHGHPDDDIEWELSESKKVTENIQKKLNNGEMLRACPKCSCLFRGPQCPECGYKPEPKTVKQSVANKSGQLVEIPHHLKESIEFEKCSRAWTKYLIIGAYRNWKANQAAAAFSREFKKPPWEIKGLKNVPSGTQWQMRIPELYPQFIRVKK